MLSTTCRLAVTMLLVTLEAPLWGQRPAPAPPSLPPVSGAAMDAHIRYLADDLLEGRAAGTRGGRLAARYIAAQFATLGLEPAGPDSSYFQPVALLGFDVSSLSGVGSERRTAVPQVSRRRCRVGRATGPRDHRRR